MVAIKGHFDGKVIVPDEPVDLPTGRALVVNVEVVGAAADETPKKREWGKQPDAVIWMADDAFDPLPDDEWDHNRVND
jgi:hypothetical protein